MFRELTLEVRQTVLFGGQAAEFVAVAAVYDVVVMVEAVIEVVRETDEELVELMVLVT